MVRNGENDVYPHILNFPQCFKKASSHIHLSTELYDKQFKIIFRQQINSLPNNKVFDMSKFKALYRQQFELE